MKVFLAGIIQGSLIEAEIHHQDWRIPIKATLNKYYPQAEVYCHYSQHPNSMTYDLPAIRKTFEDGVLRAVEADLLIAYVPSASMGTAIEMYEAAKSGTIVLTISPMAPNWVLRLYSDEIFPDIEEFDAFVASGGLDKLRAQRNEAR